MLKGAHPTKNSQHYWDATHLGSHPNPLICSASAHGSLKTMLPSRTAHALAVRLSDPLTSYLAPCISALLDTPAPVYGQAPHLHTSQGG